MSWQDVNRLRKETLPGITRLRETLLTGVARVRRKRPPDVDIYRNELREVQRDFNEQKEVLAEEWDKLGFVAILKGGYGALTSSAAAGALVSTIASSTWLQLATAIAGLGIGAGVGLAPEIASSLPARRRVREHPPFFAERLNRRASGPSS
ncbi:MAG: hypothetical protein WAO95_04435 [Burkholderiales bacterium]